MMTIALVLAFVGAACFGALAWSLAPRHELPEWAELVPEPLPTAVTVERRSHPVPARPRALPAAPSVPQQRIDVEVLGTTGPRIPAQRRYEEIQSSLPARRPAVRVEL